jgi:uncharacterized protein (TIGR04141 family)
MEVCVAGATDKKRIALNVYLLKVNPDPASGGLWSQKQFLARPIGSSGKAAQIKTEDHPLGPTGDFGTLYIRKPITETEPEWLDFVRSGLADASPLAKLKNRSVSAILLVEQNGRQFALAFGHGRFMVEPRLIEDRFGIRVVLNSISPEKVASIDRQTFDASPKISRVQTIKASSVSDFMISPEQDLLRGLVGFTKPEYKETLGGLIAGIDSFKTSVPIELSELSKLLKVALERSESKDYLARDSQGQNSQFAWVENLLPVKDKALIDELDKKVWDRLSSRNLENMWLAVPDIVDWSQVTGFRYAPTSDQTDIEANLDLARFLTTLRKGATLETVKRREILMIMASGLPAQRFSAFKCIYAEIKKNLDLFILHVGTWFRVEGTFQSAVEKYFASLSRKTFAPPFVQYAHAGEGPYNEAVCAASPITHGMLDRRLVQFGGTYDKIEVCDILKVPPTGASTGVEFIHVKRGRSSATLSHLFSQGLVASTLLVRESNFVAEVNKQLATLALPQLPNKFSAHGNEVVYAIIDGPAGTPLDLPFFSKVTLQNCGKSISAFGYSVSLMHIPESAVHLAAVAAKVAKKKAAKKAVAKKGKSRSGGPATPGATPP